MTGNPVRFIYISAGKERPTPIDPDAIYFVEGDKQIYVGNVLIADSVEPVDVASYLYPYRVKDIEVIGDGQMISGVELDEETGKVIFTRSDIAISKGVSPEPTVAVLTPDDHLTVVASTSVSGSTLYDDLVDIKFEGFATSEQGEKADAAMPSQNGVATGATIELASDPVNDLDAATKGYVDRTVSDSIAELGTVFDYRGDSSTVITDGGREEPTIDGEPVDPTQGMKKGDIVTYDGKEFLWTGDHWQSFGDEGSYALKTLRIEGSDGLVGGGELTSDITISHGATGSGEDTSYEVPEGLKIIGNISVDKFGHVQSAEYKDISAEIVATAEEAVNNILPDKLPELLDDYVTDYELESIISHTKDDAVQTANNYTDNKIADIDVNHPVYSMIGEDDQTGVYSKIYHLTKDGVNVGDAINIPRSGGSGGGGGSYVAGQGLDISGDVILHDNIGDGTSIEVVDLIVDDTDANKVTFSKINLTRDTMGHLVSSASDPETSDVSVLSEEGVRQMILEYIPTWIIEQAESTDNWLVEPISIGGVQTGNDIYFSGSPSEPFTLNYAPIDSSIGRNQVAAWAGARIFAPESITASNVSSVTFDMDGNTGIGTDVRSNQSFEAAHDVVSNNRYYVEVWVPLDRTSVLNAASMHSTIYRSYTFRASELDPVTITVEVSPENIHLTNLDNVPDVEEVRISNWEEVI